jgi:hypothetical protein
MISLRRASGLSHVATPQHGSKSEAEAYYRLNIDKPTHFTLEEWTDAHIGDAPVSTAFYRNVNELGFWREMTCTQEIGRGKGGCMVTNWKNDGDEAAGKPNLGTVAMDISPQGFVRFYVFLPSHELITSALLDDEGPKFIPRVCTSCHTGGYSDPGKSTDLGAIFREFEPSFCSRPVPACLPEPPRDNGSISTRS